MNIPSWLPALLTFTAAVLAGVGGLLQYRIQASKAAEVAAKQNEVSQKSEELRKLVEENRDLTKKVADNDKNNRELIQDIAARSGNQKELRDLIETRSRLLMIEPQVTGSLISDIITQVPGKAKDYQNMQEARTDTVARKTREYLLSWEPLMRFVINTFDRAMSQLRENKISVEVQQNEFPLTQTGGNSSYSPRVARYAGLRLDMQYNNAGIDVDTIQDAYFFVRLIVERSNKIEIEPLVLRIAEKHAYCNGKEFAAPANGIPPKELTDLIQLGLAKAVERMLVVSEVEKHP